MLCLSKVDLFSMQMKSNFERFNVFEVFQNASFYIIFDQIFTVGFISIHRPIILLFMI